MPGLFREGAFLCVRYFRILLWEASLGVCTTLGGTLLNCTAILFDTHLPVYLTVYGYLSV